MLELRPWQRRECVRCGTGAAGRGPQQDTCGRGWAVAT
jgi:hypothetical protein